MRKKKINKNKLILLILVVLLIIVVAMIIKVTNKIKKQNNIASTVIKNEIIGKNGKTISSLGWELMLVNPENKLPDNYQINLVSIDEYRKFDSRAIQYLKNMIDDMRREQVGGIWVQSSYRSIEDQTKLYNDKVQYYKSMGKRTEEAKRLTEEVISKPRVQRT